MLNWQIPQHRVENGQNTTAFMIGDACVFFISRIYTPEINLSHRKKTREGLELIGTMIKKPGHWMSYQFHHRVTVREIVYSFSVKSKVFQILTYWYIRQERPNEKYCNTVKDLILLNTVSQKDEKPHTAGLDDTAIPYIKIKITEILRETKLNTAMT